MAPGVRKVVTRAKPKMSIVTKLKKDEHEIVEADGKDEETPLLPFKSDFVSRNLGKKMSLTDNKYGINSGDLDFKLFDEDTHALTPG